jgi:hypothetical protein
VFPVRYKLNLYMLFRRSSVFKGLLSLASHILNNNISMVCREMAVKLYKNKCLIAVLEAVC